MNKLLKRLQLKFKKQVSYSDLGEFIYSYDFSTLDHKHLIPAISDPLNYARNIITMDPLEVVLLRWPPNVESAIHHHRGFFGYVVVLEGFGQDVTYTLDEGQLKEKNILRCGPSGIIDEPDGVLHKLTNPSHENDLISLHFYYPALETLEGLHIYHLEKQSIGILSENAATASWSNDKSMFKEIKENAFSCDQMTGLPSHKMVIMKPKPDKNMIGKMIIGYYSEQAHVYDNFDFKHPTRKAYTKKINELVGKSLKDHPVDHLLSIAIGTGRRSLKIRELSGKDYKIFGVDISPEMVEISKNRGIEAISTDWLEADLGSRKFDAATCLYAFSHITSKGDRLQFLKKTNQHLLMGAPFYLDVFNIDNQKEWGPKALKAFENYQLEQLGYEKGDVFYMKQGGKEVAFLHYSQEEEIKQLLEESGFEVASLHYVGYVQHSGEVVESKDEGFFMIKAIKEKEVF